LQAIEFYVLVRDEESVRRDKRARAANVEADGRFLQMIQPWARRNDAVTPRGTAASVDARRPAGVVVFLAAAASAPAGSLT
jgi:hypothetical protein